MILGDEDLKNKLSELVVQNCFSDLISFKDVNDPVTSSKWVRRSSCHEMTKELFKLSSRDICDQVL